MNSINDLIRKVVDAEMDEVLKKIDKMKSQALRLIVKNPHDTLDSIQNDISTGYITACDELTEFLSEQPEELVFRDTLKDFQERERQRFAENNIAKPFTNFDKITESPDTFADFIQRQYGYDQVVEHGNYYNIVDYLGFTGADYNRTVN